MKDEDINKLIRNAVSSSAGKKAKEVSKWLLLFLVMLVSPLLIFIFIEVLGLFMDYDKMLTVSYPFSDVIKPFLIGLADKSKILARVDLVMITMAFFIWLGLLFGEFIPVVYMKILKNKKQIPEFNSRIYFMGLLNVIGAIAYGIGYYKFWGLDIVWYTLIFRIIFAFFMFLWATMGIRLLVIGYNPILAVVLSVLAMFFLSCAFMFVFYSIVFIPLIITAIVRTLDDIAKNSIFIFWI